MTKKEIAKKQILRILEEQGEIDVNDCYSDINHKYIIPGDDCAMGAYVNIWEIVADLIRENLIEQFNNIIKLKRLPMFFECKIIE